MKKIIPLVLLINCLSFVHGQKNDKKTTSQDRDKLVYSKKEYQEAMSIKNDSIKVLTATFNQKINKLEEEKKNLSESNKSTQLLLSEMNATFFLAKIQDNYKTDNFKNYKFKESDNANLRKYNTMLLSLSADTSLSIWTELFDKAKKFNEIYFKLYDINRVFNYEFDATAVKKSIPKIDALVIPQEFAGLIESKNQMKTLNEAYCKTQFELFSKLKKYDEFIDKKTRTDEIKKLINNEKYKNYKYLVDMIGKYAEKPINLPETKCN
jgi:hypothetical protein